MDVTPEVRLKRYLHYASEEGIYKPGCRFHFKDYSPEKLPSLNQLAAENKESTILECIRKVHAEKTSAYPEALIFAVAQCVRNKESTSLRVGGYELAEKICTSSEFLFLFFKFTFEATPKKGSGRACRRLVKNWYLKKSALDLAKIVAQKPKYKGWSHADILAVSHVKCSDTAKAAVLKYIVKGLPEAKKAYGDDPAAEEVLSYLSYITNSRKTVDPNNAVKCIDSYMLSIEHVNCALLRNKRVWMALLRLMSLPKLLDHLQLLAKKGMLRSGPAWDYDFVKVICDAMNNPATIKDSGIHPSRAFIELCTYKCAARMKLELAAKLNGKLPKPPPALNTDILKALEKVIRSSFKHVESTGLTYAIGVDVSETMSIIRCGFCRYVMSAQAASLITLCLLKAEKNVDVLAFTQGIPSLKQVTISPAESTIEETQNILKQVPGGPVDVGSLFNWASQNGKKIDVFLVLSSYIKQTSTVVEDLEKYSQAAGMPNARVVLCNLSCYSRLPGYKSTSIENSKVLTISGFDSKICKVIEAFAKGAF